VILPRSFYARPTVEVALDLLGKVLVHRTPAGVASGAIVEVEAYVGEDDPACHAASGRTRRNAPLYGAPGHAYVYFTYGLHYLVNAVTEREGFPAAVLIRALDPLEGHALMRRRRAAVRGRSAKAVLPDACLCRGPANVTVALGIAAAQNTRPLFRRPLTIEDAGLPIGNVAWGPRIGISKGTDRAWRGWVAGHGSVSRG